MAQYPGADPTFTTKTDADYVEAAHVNALQDEVTAIGAALRGTLAHNVTTDHQFVSATQYRALLYHSAVQSVANTTWAALLFDTEDTDIGTLHSTVSNTSRITVPTGGAGVWLLTGSVDFAANASGIRAVQFYKNGAAAGSYAVLPGTSSAAVQATHSQLITLADGDYVELYAYQSSGGALNTGGVARGEANQFQAIRLF